MKTHPTNSVNVDKHLSTENCVLFSFAFSRNFTNNIIKDFFETVDRQRDICYNVINTSNT